MSVSPSLKPAFSGGRLGVSLLHLLRMAGAVPPSGPVPASAPQQLLASIPAVPTAPIVPGYRSTKARKRVSAWNAEGAPFHFCSAVIATRPAHRSSSPCSAAPASQSHTTRLPLPRRLWPSSPSPSLLLFFHHHQSVCQLHAVSPTTPLAWIEEQNRSRSCIVEEDILIEIATHFKRPKLEESSFGKVQEAGTGNWEPRTIPRD